MNGLWVLLSLWVLPSLWVPPPSLWVLRVCVCVCEEEDSALTRQQWTLVR